MDIVVFSVWKFRHIEGLLKNMFAYDVGTTKYVDPETGYVSWIKYNYKDETVTIERTVKKKDSFWSMIETGEIETQTVECKLSELEAKLKELGMYEERPERDRHSLAGVQQKAS
jgi:hypothetical protein